MNWDSRNQRWTPIVGDAARLLRERARTLRHDGVPVRQIATLLGRSVSRVYELLR